jgi:hypothetical protein
MLFVPWHQLVSLFFGGTYIGFSPSLRLQKQCPQLLLPQQSL